MTTQAATLTVSGAATALTVSNPSNVSGATAGSTAKFTVTASGGTAPYTYQWQVKTPAGTSFANSGMTGNKTATLSVGATAERSGYQFRCVVKDSAGKTVTTQAATLTVSGAVASTVVVTGKNGGTLTYDKTKDQFRASYSTENEGQYLVIMMKGTSSTFSWNDDSVLYIDQMASANGAVSFDMLPKKTETSSVWLSGAGMTKPVLIGTVTVSN